MISFSKALWLVWPVLAMAMPVLAQQGKKISQTRHNLSVTGPGEFRSTDETRICVFCHTSHLAGMAAPLWNRDDSTTSYLPYESPTYSGTVAQPNGTSKLCLSCHDGTIALGHVVSRDQEIQMSPGRRYMSSGKKSLGTNLRDDHPISFNYNASRGGRGVDYRAVPNAAGRVRLDDNGRVQCTSCHDPHDNTHGEFLRESDRMSGLCLSCHDPAEWDTSIHANVNASWNGRGRKPWPKGRYSTVQDNGCASCHSQHGAGRSHGLLAHESVDQGCIACHNGNVALTNLETDMMKLSVHARPQGMEGSFPSPRSRDDRFNMNCASCHHPHKVRGKSGDRPGMPGALHGARGVGTSGTQEEQAQNGYEVCYRCHADNHGAVTYVPRVIPEANVRLEFDISNPSFHPVEGPGRSTDVPSLMPPWTTASQMTCWDCHGSDTSKKFGGSGANGPHGSNFRPLLGAKSNSKDLTPESAAEYALCYRCHSRGSILSNASFGYHRQHIVQERTPCSVCHDPHGVSSSSGNPINNSHLINFDASVVFPSEQNPGVREFVDGGYRTGSCTLTCHGFDHVDSKY